MYVMMSKVVIEDVTDTVIHFSFSGREADKHLEEFTGLNHTQNHEVIHHNSLSILYTADELNKVFRFDIFIDTDGTEEAKQLWTQIKEIATTLGDNGLDLLNIAAGLPEISAKSSEDWIPQMVNYIQVGGVDFKKGCYPGLMRLLY